MRVLPAFLPKGHNSLPAVGWRRFLTPPLEISWVFKEELAAQSCQPLCEKEQAPLRSHLTDTSGHHSPPKIVAGVLIQPDVWLEVTFQPRPSPELGHQVHSGPCLAHCHPKYQTSKVTAPGGHAKIPIPSQTARAQ